MFKKLILVITLAVLPMQAHAFGWFLLGMAVGSSGGSNTVNKYQMTPMSDSFMEVQNCTEQKEKVLIRSNMVVGFKEERKTTYGAIDGVVVLTINGHPRYCLYDLKMKDVKDRFFPAPLATTEGE